MLSVNFLGKVKDDKVPVFLHGVSAIFQIENIELIAGKEKTSNCSLHANEASVPAHLVLLLEWYVKWSPAFCTALFGGEFEKMRRLVTACTLLGATGWLLNNLVF